MAVASIGVIDIDIDPVVHVGPLSVHWYGVTYVVAFAVALYAGAVPHLERRGVPRSLTERIAAWTIIFGLIGARLYYVVQNDVGSYLRHPQDILAVWQGGMAFFGAIIGGLLTVAVLTWRYRLSWWPFADAACVFAVVGQPIGRIGNLINGDVLGYPSDLPWATRYTNPNAILQAGYTHVQAYQPAALYELIGTVLVGILLFQIRRRGVRDGVLTITYVAAYAVSQLVIFGFRGSEPQVLGPLKQAQVTAIVVLVVGVPLLVLAWRRFPPGPAGEPVAVPARLVGDRPASAGPEPRGAATAAAPGAAFEQAVSEGRARRGSAEAAEAGGEADRGAEPVG